MTHNSITPLLHLIKAGYKTNTSERHLKGRRLALFYLVRWTLILAAWALLSFIAYIIID
jgi:hypothetical protein